MDAEIPTFIDAEERALADYHEVEHEDVHAREHVVDDDDVEYEQRPALITIEGLQAQVGSDPDSSNWTDYFVDGDKAIVRIPRNQSHETMHIDTILLIQKPQPIPEGPWEIQRKYLTIGPRRAQDTAVYFGDRGIVLSPLPEWIIGPNWMPKSEKAICGMLFMLSENKEFLKGLGCEASYLDYLSQNLKDVCRIVWMSVPLELKVVLRDMKIDLLKLKLYSTSTGDPPGSGIMAGSVDGAGVYAEHLIDQNGREHFRVLPSHDLR